MILLICLIVISYFRSSGRIITNLPADALPDQYSAPATNIHTPPAQNIHRAPVQNIGRAPALKIEKAPGVKIHKVPVLNIQKAPDLNIHKKPALNIQRAPDPKIHKIPALNIQKAPDLNIHKVPALNIQKEPDQNIQHAPDLNIHKVPARSIHTAPAQNTESASLEDVDVVDAEIDDAPNQITTEEAFAHLMRKFCGKDKIPPDEPVEEGLANIENFPWLGSLIYPYDSRDNSVTTVILISKEMVIAAALDIDKYPKDDFRERSRVVLGSTCFGPFIRIREYTFHPDFSKTTFSTLALIQLEPSRLIIDVYPVCPPPVDIQNTEQVYALTLTDDCYNSAMVRIYNMSYVDMSECQDFYRRAELDIESLWPSDMACAKGRYGGHCIWRSGTALVVHEEGQWRLLGLGTYGPGCESPCRFLDYGMYHAWVKRSISRVGQPSVTKVASNHLVLRRTATNVQRFGVCDKEEMKYEIYSDRIEILPQYHIDLDQIGEMDYNVTLVDNIDYQCITMRVWNLYNASGQPTIYLRRWCTNPTPSCAESTTLGIVFFVKVKFRHDCILRISAYGTDRKYIETKKFLHYYNLKHWKYAAKPKTYIEGYDIIAKPRPNLKVFYDFSTENPWEQPHELGWSSLRTAAPYYRERFVDFYRYVMTQREKRLYSSRYMTPFEDWPEGESRTLKPVEVPEYAVPFPQFK